MLSRMILTYLENDVMGWPHAASKHPHSGSHSPPPKQDGGEKKSKSWKLFGQREGSLISEGKREKTGDAKAIIHHLSQEHWCPASLQTRATLADNGTAFYSTTSTVNCWALHYIVWNILLANFMSALPVVFRPNFLPTSSLLALEQVKLGEKKNTREKRKKIGRRKE